MTWRLVRLWRCRRPLEQLEDRAERRARVGLFIAPEATRKQLRETAALMTRAEKDDALELLDLACSVERDWLGILELRAAFLLAELRGLE